MVFFKKGIRCVSPFLFPPVLEAEMLKKSTVTGLSLIHQQHLITFFSDLRSIAIHYQGRFQQPCFYLLLSIRLSEKIRRKNLYLKRRKTLIHTRCGISASNLLLYWESALLVTKNTFCAESTRKPNLLCAKLVRPGQHSAL